MAPASGRNGSAKRVGGAGLPGRGDVIDLAFNGHQGGPPHGAKVDAGPIETQIAPAEGIVLEDRDDVLNEELAGQVHQRIDE
jgi:hypothetical protein